MDIVVTGAGVDGTSQIYEPTKSPGRQHRVTLVDASERHEAHAAKTQSYSERAVLRMVGAMRLKESA